MTPELYWLALTAIATTLMAVPYVLEGIFRLGMVRALGYSVDGSSGGFERPGETPAAWAVRAYRAHRNAVENLVVFATLVLVAHFANLGGGIVAQAAEVYFFARLAHYIIYTLGLPILRTLVFFVALSAIGVIALALLGWIT